MIGASDRLGAIDDQLSDLRRQALAVAETATAALDTFENSWITGHSRAFSLELAARGWLGMTLPTSVGGHGRAPIERFVVYEALISEGAPVAATWFADRQIGPTLVQFGTPAQQARWLPGIIGGTDMWCIGMSEPDAGSDVAAIRTRARPVGEDWVVSGRKVWTSGAADADWCYLVCRTDPDAPRHAGLSEFVVDMRSPGISVEPIRDMAGGRHFCEVVYDDVRVPGDHLVGTPNDSFRQIMRQMEHERGGIDRLASNRRLLRDTVDALGTPDAIARQRIAGLASDYFVGRQLVLREVMGVAPPGFSAVTKAFCTEFEQRVAEFCGAAAGANSLLAGRVAHNLCYAPCYTIMGGTSEILRNVVAERLLGLPRGVAL